MRGSFRAHLVQSVKELLNKGKIDPIVIPGGATGDIKQQTYHGKSL